MGEDWKWHGEEEKASIVVQSVQAVAVYTNSRGEIVIRQEDPMRESDQIVIIPRSMANALTKAIKDEAKKPFTPE